MQKAVTFLYTNDKHTEIGIKETIPFTLVSKKSWTKYKKRAEDLHIKNFKMLKKNEESIRGLKTLPLSWMIESILWKYPS